MKKRIVILYMLLIGCACDAQVLTVTKNDCNVQLKNATNGNLVLNFDLLQGSFLMTATQVTIADNKRTQALTLVQAYGFPSLDSLYRQLINWKADCINFHK